MSNLFETPNIEGIKEEDIAVAEPKEIKQSDPTNEEAENLLDELAERVKEIEKRKN